MTGDAHPAANRAQSATMERYYRFHSRIYDATRWSFLFGRTGLVQAVGDAGLQPQRILEVGCGTGKNLRPLARAFPGAQLTGLDVAGPMLSVARRKLSDLGDRLTLIERPYDQPVGEGEPFDLVVFSYCLTMINPGWEAALDAAADDLSPDGRIAIVDFHDSPVGLFKRWMGVNHVRMDGHLEGPLKARFSPDRCQVRKAYGGLWTYLTFIGRPNG